METRIEHDSLGDVHVPAEALYGAQTQRATQNFQISGLKPRQAFIWSMATIKRAAAEVNCDLGLLDRDRANAIIQTAQEVIDGKWNDQFVVDPVQAIRGSRVDRADELLADDLRWVGVDDPRDPR
ncbi:MAG TPA: lyase family protein, partial [Anaerolineales bacterium]|nr:lyase family protein [Anaerolineales bacterium]